MTQGATRDESLGHYEMLWDCGHCDTKKLLGKTHRHCPHCGAPQDASKRYFPSDEDKVKVEDHVFTGADRKCASCGSATSARADHCGQCGAPLGEAKPVPLVDPRVPAAPAPKRKSRLWWGVAVVVLLCALVWHQCIRTKSVAMQVAGHRWATSIAIEEFREVTESDWRDGVPHEARQVRCHRKQRSTRDVPDGEVCRDTKSDKGDGTFEVVRQCTPKTRQEGVDDDYCQFQIDRWQVVDELKQNGKGLTETWAIPPELPPGSGRGARRIGAKNATWTLELFDGKAAQTCDVAERAWRRYADGQKITAQVRASSGNLVCSSL